ncbi:MAG TPA: 3-oxo-tetronate kinase [Devosia sp.]|jgi:uncharacterized protein YgbK (DUF1537 family)|nr:3-oxo-tetronate kinase [Devosia sp.]
MLLGAIADDFTGATDLASIIAREGMPVVQLIGVPDTETLALAGDAAAVVVSLKTRTAPPHAAIADSLATLTALRRAGAEQIFFKYCSTFDSTGDGNIGPVADALAQALGADLAIVCPAYPANGRTVFRGHLFVGDQLLQDSPMKDHPLTPMLGSNLVDLMAAQSTRPVSLVRYDMVGQDVVSIQAEFRRLRDAGFGYAVTDAITDADLRRLGEAVHDHPLITGGSAIAMSLPDNYRRAGKLDGDAVSQIVSGYGRAAVLAGSCSAATRSQLRRACALWPSYQLDIDTIASGEDVAALALEWAAEQPERSPVVIYGSADPDTVASAQARYGRERAGEMMERVVGNIASGLCGQGTGRFIVAGGETSGAVVSALGIRALRIGQLIAPGVPWTQSISDSPVALSLKSGNFGGDDFFEHALDVLP